MKGRVFHSFSEGATRSIPTLKIIGNTVEFNSLAGQDTKLYFSDNDLAHGMTAILPTNVWAAITQLSSTLGGAKLTGMSGGDAQALELTGIMGSADPTDSLAAIKIVGAKKSGTGKTALAAAETVLSIVNNTTSLINVLGNGNVGFTVANPLYPLHITSAPVNGALLGLRPASIAASDILLFITTPSSVTGNLSIATINVTVTADAKIVFFNQDNTVGTSNAYFELKTGGSTAGDPMFVFTVNGATNWTAGIDNSDSDKFKVSFGAALGTNDVLTMTSSPFLVGINRSSPTATLDILQTAATSGSPIGFLFTAAAHTTTTASTEVTDFTVNCGSTLGISGGALTTNRTARIQRRTFTFTSASVLTNAITFDVDGAPSSGNANTTITNPTCVRFGGSATYIASTSLSYKNLLLNTHTVTLSGTTSVTTAAGGASNLFVGIITLTDVSAVTVDIASSVYIAGPVAAAGSVTLTTALSLWVDAGTSRFDGPLDLSNIAAGSANIIITATSDTPTVTFGAGAETIKASAAPAGYMEITVAGAARYIPYWA